MVFYVRLRAAAARTTKWRIPRMAEKLTIPYKRPIKPVYIRKLIAFIDAVSKGP
jgi:hypothetical protein